MGTTRDAVDSVWKFKGKTFVLVDTAGMRKKSKIDEPVEKYSVIRSIRAIDNCDVAIFILDAEDMLTEQDKKIIGYIHEAGKGLILFVNKWDTIEKGNTTNVEFEKEIRKGLPLHPMRRFFRIGSYQAENPSSWRHDLCSGRTGKPSCSDRCSQ